MTVPPTTLINSIVETTMHGTGLTTNNMSMFWTDAADYSRTMYMAGKISYLANATLTLRFRIIGGTIIIPWVINLSNLSVATAIPYVITINYITRTGNLYQASCNLSIAGLTTGTSYMYNSQVTCTLGSYNRAITAQWGAASAQNSFSVTEFTVTNNYVG